MSTIDKNLVVWSCGLATATMMMVSATESSTTESDATVVSLWGTLHGGSWRQTINNVDGISKGHATP